MTSSSELDPSALRVRIDLGYDGTGYAGWARQPTLPTIQGELERALTQIDDRIGSVVCAGRTDAGVHARSQVVHVDIPGDVWAGRGPDGLVHQLNRFTGPQIYVRTAQAAPNGFDARFSALSRAYSYRLCDDHNAWDPLFRQWVTLHRRPLDAAAMALAAPELVGEHDFAAFCRPREGASTVRRILRLDVYRDGGRRVVVTVESDAFCHSMVRSIVGALLAVGEGRLDGDELAGILQAAQRVPRFTIAPAHGLALVEVAYPPDQELASQAQRARRFRGRST